MSHDRRHFVYPTVVVVDSATITTWTSVFAEGPTVVERDFIARREHAPRSAAAEAWEVVRENVEFVLVHLHHGGKDIARRQVMVLGVTNAAGSL